MGNNNAILDIYRNIISQVSITIDSFYNERLMHKLNPHDSLNLTVLTLGIDDQ